MSNTKKATLPTGNEDVLALGNRTNMPAATSSPALTIASATGSRGSPINLDFSNKLKKTIEQDISMEKSYAENNQIKAPGTTRKLRLTTSKRAAQIIDNDGADELSDSVFETKRARRELTRAATRTPISNRRPSSRVSESVCSSASAATPIITRSTPSNNKSGTPISSNQTGRTPSVGPVVNRKKNPFCCASSSPERDDYLWSCNNETCFQRHAVLMLQKELKRFNHPTPIASVELQAKAKYMIRVVKYIPSATNEIALLSRSRKKVASTADWLDSWELDTAFSSTGRFYIEVKRPDGVLFDDEKGSSVAIWAEVEGLDAAEKLRPWDLKSESQMFFNCFEHREEIWVAQYWNRK